MIKQRHLVKTYEIRNKEDLNVLKPSIIKWCNFDNARAYICLNGKSKKKSASNMLIELANIVAGRYEANLKSIYNSVVGDVYSNSSETKKTWIIDIDGKNYDIEKIKEYLKTIEPLNENKIIAEIPTKNGLHLITTSFNIQKFTKEFPEIDIHKNNPTILYVP